MASLTTLWCSVSFYYIYLLIFLFIVHSEHSTLREFRYHTVPPWLPSACCSYKPKNFQKTFNNKIHLKIQRLKLSRYILNYFFCFSTVKFFFSGFRCIWLMMLMQSFLWRKVSSNRCYCSKISSHRAKQYRHQLYFLTVLPLSLLLFILNDKPGKRCPD